MKCVFTRFHFLMLSYFHDLMSPCFHVHTEPSKQQGTLSGNLAFIRHQIPDGFFFINLPNAQNAPLFDFFMSVVKCHYTSGIRTGKDKSGIKYERLKSGIGNPLKTTHFSFFHDFSSAVIFSFITSVFRTNNTTHC